MSVAIEVKAPGAPADVVQVFVNSVHVFQSGFEQMQRDAGLPETTVKAILADDFVGEVNAVLKRSADYRQERIGGNEAVGKTVSLSEDEAVSTVIFDGTLWHGWGPPDLEAFRQGIVSHELAHPILNHARAASGAGHAMPSVPSPDDALADLARSLADEYRADRLGDLALGAVATAVVAGVQQPYRAWVMEAETRVASATTVLTPAKETWIGEIQRFHRGELSATELWMSVASSLYDVLVQVVHAQAYADSANVGIDLLSLATVAELPAVRDCVGEHFERFLALLRGNPFLASLAETRTIERDIDRIGTGMFSGILASLGITWAVGDDDGTVVLVAPDPG